MDPHPNFNFMIFDLYAVISNFAINFAHNFIGCCLLFQYLLFLLCLLLLHSLLSDISESLDGNSEKSCFMRCPFFFFNQSRSMMSLTNLGLTPDPLVRTLLAPFLCVSVIPLVVLLCWGLTFSHQQELGPKVIFCV